MADPYNRDPQPQSVGELPGSPWAWGTGHDWGSAPSGEQVGAGRGEVAAAPGAPAAATAFPGTVCPLPSSGPDTSTNVARRGRSEVQPGEGLFAPPKPPGSQRAPANPGERG